MLEINFKQLLNYTLKVSSTNSSFIIFEFIEVTLFIFLFQKNIVCPTHIKQILKRKYE